MRGRFFSRCSSANTPANIAEPRRHVVLDNAGAIVRQTWIPPVFVKYPAAPFWATSTDRETMRAGELSPSVPRSYNPLGQDVGTESLILFADAGAAASDLGRGARPRNAEGLWRASRMRNRMTSMSIYSDPSSISPAQK